MDELGKLAKLRVEASRLGIRETDVFHFSGRDELYIKAAGRFYAGKYAVLSPQVKQAQSEGDLALRLAAMNLGAFASDAVRAWRADNGRWVASFRDKATDQLEMIELEAQTEQEAKDEIQQKLPVHESAVVIGE